MARYGAFKPSYSGLGEFLRGEELQADMRRRAGWIAAEAEAIAPVGSAAQGDKHPGQYKASFEVSSGVEIDATGHPRAYGRVKNTAPHAAAVEYGRAGRSGREGKAAHHGLGRSIDAAGG